MRRSRLARAFQQLSQIAGEARRPRPFTAAVTIRDGASVPRDNDARTEIDLGWGQRPARPVCAAGLQFLALLYVAFLYSLIRPSTISWRSKLARRRGAALSAGPSPRAVSEPVWVAGLGDVVPSSGMSGTNFPVPAGDHFPALSR